MAVLLLLTAFLLCVAAAVIGIVALLAWQIKQAVEALALRVNAEARISQQTAATLTAMGQTVRMADPSPPVVDWPPPRRPRERIRRFRD